MTCNAQEKDHNLIQQINTLPPGSRVLIFCSTKRMCAPRPACYLVITPHLLQQQAHVRPGLAPPHHPKPLRTPPHTHTHTHLPMMIYIMRVE